MPSPALPKPEDRANVIAYLNKQSDSPLPLPARPAAAAPAAGANPAQAAAEAKSAPAGAEQAKTQPVLNQAQATPGKNVKDQAAPSDQRAGQANKWPLLAAHVAAVDRGAAPRAARRADHRAERLRAARRDQVAEQAAHSGADHEADRAV